MQNQLKVQILFDFSNEILIYKLETLNIKKLT